jgi:hypothetical protein
MEMFYFTFHRISFRIYWLSSNYKKDLTKLFFAFLHKLDNHLHEAQAIPTTQRQKKNRP